MNYPIKLADPSGMKPQGDDDGWRAGQMQTFYGGSFSFDAVGLTISGQTKNPSDWVRGADGKLTWINATGNEAEQSVGLIGATTVFGPGRTSFFGSKSERAIDNKEMDDLSKAYLANVAVALNNRAGLDNNALNQLTKEYLVHIMMGGKFGNSKEPNNFNKIRSFAGSAVNSEIEGHVGSKIISGIFSISSRTAGAAYMTVTSVQKLGAGSTMDGRIRAKAVQQFKSTVYPSITMEDLIKIYNHSF